jgi:hypothetical protein
MPGGHVFLIESDSSGHRLSIDGAGIGTFPTLGAAEANAAHVAAAFAPDAMLRFELDFKWTLSDLEIRTATVIAPDHSEHTEDLYVDR